MVLHITIDRTPLIVGVDMILHIIGAIGHILDLDLALPIVGHLPGDMTGRTHLTTTIIPVMIVTTEGTDIGQFRGVFPQRQGFLVGVIPAVILPGLGEL